MTFNHLKIKQHLFRTALEKYLKSSNKNKDTSNFRTGYLTGFNNCLKWIIKISPVDNVGDLKKLLNSVKGDNYGK